MTEVYVSPRGNITNHYHKDKDCFNCPEDARTIALAKIEPTYDPCGRCADGDATSVPPDFECQQCGKRKDITTTAARTPSACMQCGEMTQWEQVK